MSKLSASRGVVCAFSIVAVTMVAMALLVMVHGRNGKAQRASASGSSSSAGSGTPAARSRMQASYAALPLAFERNQGQTDAQVKYLARGSGYTLFLTANDAVFSLRSRHAQKDSNAVVRMHLAGGNSLAKIEGGDSLPGVANYFLGNARGKWSTGVPRFGRVAYQDVYPGVNLAFHGTGHELEFDFVVAPEANATPIAFRFSGNRGMKTDDAGNLIVISAAGNVLLHKPVAYQERNGTREPVDARFAVTASNQVGFELGGYDRSRELVIDPSVSYAYSTYLGGTGNDAGYGIAFDSTGNAYITGQTDSTNYPTTAGVVATSNKGNTDVFVTKFAPDGSSLVYSTYVGGSGDDSGNGIAVDSSGNAYVAGGTASADFPKTAGAYQTALKGTTGNAFILKLNSTGTTLLYCTYLGGTGTDTAFGMAIDGSGNVYAAGKTSSSDFPLSPVTPLQATIAGGFVSKVSPAGGGASDLKFSTYLGASASDFATSVAVGGPSSNVYVTGSTSSGSFHTTAGAVQTIFGGGFSDAFVAVINPAGSAYVYSTFLGGSDTDTANGIAVDATGDAYVTGQTASSATSTTPFPLKSPLQGTLGGGTYDAFVTEVNPTGTSLVYSTYLGGGGVDVGVGIALDGGNNAYVTGQTASTNFPTADPTQSTLGGGNDAFVSEINPAGSALVFSTYLGGLMDEDDGGKFGAIAVDGPGANIYVAGNTLSLSTDTPPFPTHTPLQSANAGGNDAFVVKYAQQTFTIGAATPAAVSPGTSATSTVTLTAYNSYSSPVNLSCAVSGTGSPLPACSATSFSPQPVTPVASPGATSTLSITTTAATAGNLHPRTIFYATWLPIGGIALIGVSFSSARSRRKKLLGFLIVGMIMTLLFLPACGGSSSKTSGGGGGGGGGTPAGSYTVTITGTGTDAAATTQTTQVTLTVN